MGTCHADMKGLNKPVVEQQALPREAVHATINHVVLKQRVTTDVEFKKFYPVPQSKMTAPDGDSAKREMVELEATRTITFYNPETDKVWFQLFEYGHDEGNQGMIILNHNNEFLFRIKRNLSWYPMEGNGILLRVPKCFVYDDYNTNQIFGIVGRDEGENKDYSNNKHFLMIDGRTIYETLAEPSTPFQFVIRLPYGVIAKSKNGKDLIIGSNVDSALIALIYAGLSFVHSVMFRRLQ
eukprot:348747_1